MKLEGKTFQDLYRTQKSSCPPWFSPHVFGVSELLFKSFIWLAVNGLSKQTLSPLGVVYLVEWDKKVFHWSSNYASKDLRRLFQCSGIWKTIYDLTSVTFTESVWFPFSIHSSCFAPPQLSLCLSQAEQNPSLLCKSRSSEILCTILPWPYQASLKLFS